MDPLSELKASAVESAIAWLRGYHSADELARRLDTDVCARLNARSMQSVDFWRGVFEHVGSLAMYQAEQWDRPRVILVAAPQTLWALMEFAYLFSPKFDQSSQSIGHVKTGRVVMVGTRAQEFVEALYPEKDNFGLPSFKDIVLETKGWITRGTTRYQQKIADSLISRALTNGFQLVGERIEYQHHRPF